jgi:crotonobetainyl-CoA:carnitine CoA-transferase CaiB-like acyl-CoA transferase
VVYGTEPVSGPLHGIRIVMMGGLRPAPFCGMLLGDLGADVIRVDAGVIAQSVDERRR